MENILGTRKEFENSRKELESIVSPITNKLYTASENVDQELKKYIYIVYMMNSNCYRVVLKTDIIYIFVVQAF